MINLAISLGVGILLAVIIRVAGFPWPAAIIPATLVFIGTFVMLGRRIFIKLQAVMGEVQKELSTMTANPREQKVKVEKAIKLLEGALALSRWQFLVEAEVQGQIGILKYMFKDIDGAQAAFAKSSARNYMARAMQAAIHYQKKNFGPMEAAFEDAVKHGKKEGLMWAAYAWCLVQNKEKDKALKVLSRAVENNPSDEKLKGALGQLQNDKRLKMKAWEPMWWQLGLEAPTAPQPMFSGGGRGMRFRR